MGSLIGTHISNVQSAVVRNIARRLILLMNDQKIAVMIINLGIMMALAFMYFISPSEGFKGILFLLFMISGVDRFVKGALQCD